MTATAPPAGAPSVGLGGELRARPPRYGSLRPHVAWRSGPRPPDWCRRFGRAAPLELEIGVGDGEYLVRRAGAHPEIDLVGVEARWDRLQRALRRIHRGRVPNVRVVHGDARTVLARLLMPRALAHAYCLFPCPWPKRRHRCHRLFSTGFLRLLNSRLHDDGDARVVTDDPDYAAWVLAQTAETGFAASLAEPVARLDTKYERRWVAAGRAAFIEIHLVKREHVDLPLQEDVAVRTHHLDHFDPDRFRPQPARGDVPVSFGDFLYDPVRGVALQRATVVEEELVQEVWIAITREPGGWHVRPLPGCPVVPTAGVQRALDLVRAAALGSTQDVSQLPA